MIYESTCGSILRTMIKILENVFIFLFSILLSGIYDYFELRSEHKVEQTKQLFRPKYSEN